MFFLGHRRQKTVPDVQQSQSICDTKFDWQKTHFSHQKLSNMSLSSHGIICNWPLERTVNILNVIRVNEKCKKLRQSTVTECKVKRYVSVQCASSAISLPMENRHKAVVVDREPRMKKEKSQFWLYQRPPMTMGVYS